jgi:hypothetical protein
LPPESKRAARQGDPIRIPISAPDNASEPAVPQVLQARRIARLFSMEFETAATIARLAYGASQ